MAGAAETQFKVGTIYGRGRMNLNRLVPQKGLEPPLPCENMDLNHARLPIPPLRHAGESPAASANFNPLKPRAPRQSVAGRAETYNRAWDLRAAGNYSRPRPGEESPDSAGQCAG